jgi:hypothetical protein
MYKRVMLIGVFGISVVTMLVADAFGYHGNYSVGGSNTTKGVRSKYVSA